jgi:hypothetical protein
LVDPVGLPQLLDVQVQQQHLCLHTQRDRGGVHPGDAGAEHDHLGGVHAGHTTHEHAAATTLSHQMVGAGLGCEPSGHLAHRREQG